MLKATLVGKEETFRSLGIEGSHEIELDSLIVVLRRQFGQEYPAWGMRSEFPDDHGTSPASDFWNSPTIEELAEAQNVKPLQDIKALFGTWPGEEDDGFEEEITALRQQDIQKAGDS